MDKIVGVLLIATLAIVSVASLSYYVLSQPNQTQNNPSPTPTPTPLPSEIPTEPISIPKPSVPDFTVEYVDNSYYVPPTYEVDEYSGETVQVGGGFTVTNKSIELTIKNQPFTPYVFRDDEGVHEIYLHYQVGYKGHFGEDWHYTTASPNDPSSDYTVILFGLEWDIWQPTISLGALSSGDHVDFQVQARIGYNSVVEPSQHIMDPGVYVFHGESSEWSTTQTITIP